MDLYGPQSLLLDLHLLLVGWGGDTSPNAPPPRRLDSRAFGASFLVPPVEVWCAPLI